MPDTIQLIRDAGIKLWVLTGDKLETARNIGLPVFGREERSSRQGGDLKPYDVPGDGHDASEVMFNPTIVQIYTYINVYDMYITDITVLKYFI